MQWSITICCPKQVLYLSLFSSFASPAIIGHRMKIFVVGPIDPGAFLSLVFILYVSHFEPLSNKDVNTPAPDDKRVHTQPPPPHTHAYTHKHMCIRTNIYATKLFQFLPTKSTYEASIRWV